MTPEEFQRIKEAEKEHLRSLRKPKETVRELERQKRMTRAVRSVTTIAVETMAGSNAPIQHVPRPRSVAASVMWSAAMAASTSQ